MAVGSKNVADSGRLMIAKSARYMAIYAVVWDPTRAGSYLLEILGI